MMAVATASPLTESAARIEKAKAAVRSAEQAVEAAREKALDLAPDERAATGGPHRDVLADRRAARLAEDKAGLPDAWERLDAARAELRQAEHDRKQAARAELAALRARYEPAYRDAEAEAVARLEEFGDALARMAAAASAYRAVVSGIAKVADLPIHRDGFGPGWPEENVLRRLAQWARKART